MLNIPNLKEKDRVEGRMLAAEKHLQTTKDGKPFLRLQLLNRSGSIEAVLWNNADAAHEMLVQSPQKVVDVKGVVVLFQQERRIRLHSIAPASEDAARLEDFLPASARDPEEMAEELHGTIRKVRNPFLRRLLETVFRDPPIWEAYRNAPAAKMMHHAYLGGLLEHSLSLARLVQLVAKHYPFLDQDLLLAGALLHDLGKAWELRADAGFEYSDAGRLVGHIQLGLETLQRKIDGIPEFPPSLATQIKHLVLSHHGQMDFGSPKEPMTLEAVCLHGLDDLDAKLWGIHDYLRKEAGPGKQWTAFHRVHQRYFRIPESFEGGLPPQEALPEEPDEDPPDLFAETSGAPPQKRYEE